MSTLNSTEPHFVRCIKPNEKKSPLCFDSNFVLRQLRYLGEFREGFLVFASSFLGKKGIKEVVAIRQRGFAIRRSHADFISRSSYFLLEIWRAKLFPLRYRMLAPSDELDIKARGAPSEEACGFGGLLSFVTFFLAVLVWLVLMLSLIESQWLPVCLSTNRSSDIPRLSYQGLLYLTGSHIFFRQWALNSVPPFYETMQLVSAGLGKISVRLATREYEDTLLFTSVIFNFSCFSFDRFISGPRICTHWKSCERLLCIPVLFASSFVRCCQFCSFLNPNFNF